MLIQKFWPIYPLFAKRNFFRTWHPCWRIWHSCLYEVLKNVTNRFLVPKNLYNQIFRSFRLLVQHLRSFYVFFEKIQRPLSPFWFFVVPVSRKIYLLLQFLRYRDAFFCIPLTTELSIEVWNRFLNFLPQKLVRTVQNQKRFLKKNLALEGCK